MTNNAPKSPRAQAQPSSIDGYDSQDPRLPGVYIRYTSVHRDAKGTGIGTWLYRQLIDWADEQGLPVYSDASVSAAARLGVKFGRGGQETPG